MWMDNWILNQKFEHWPIVNGATSPSHRYLFRFFEAAHPLVVLSSSNQESREVISQNRLELDVPIVKRRGGGGTVTLSRGCLIFTLAFKAKEIFNNKEYFYLINQLWIDALEQMGVKELNQKGISDITLGNRKVAGTSLFRSKHLLVYQGSLLVDANLDLLDLTLQHPSKEPDYRQGRSHREFLTTLKESGYPFLCHQLQEHCSQFVETHFWDRFAPHLFDPESLNHQ